MCLSCEALVKCGGGGIVVREHLTQVARNLSIKKILEAKWACMFYRDRYCSCTASCSVNTMYQIVFYSTRCQTKPKTFNMMQLQQRSENQPLSYFLWGEKED